MTERRVEITGGMVEFVGVTGRVIGEERGMLRVELDEPVAVYAVGMVAAPLCDPRRVRTIGESRS